MEHLTITSSVLRITGNCVGAARTLWEIRSAWKRAPVTVDTLCSQLKLTAASLSQIQSLLLGDTDVLKDKPDLVDTFDATLTSCMVLTSWLEKIMQNIKKGVLDGRRTTWKTKFKTLWNEEDIKELLHQLHTQQGAISVLLDLLQLDSISEIRRLARRSEALLRELVANTRDIRRSYAVDAPASILSRDEESGSVFSQLIGTKIEDNSFETVILSTKVYSNAFTGALDTKGDDHLDDARTVVEAPALNTNLAPISKAASDIPELAIHVLNIKPAIGNRLSITGVDAIASLDHTATSETELSFRKLEWIDNIRKRTESRYYCQSGSKINNMSGPQACFDRSKVIIALKLNRPLRVRAKVASKDFPQKGDATYQKGDVLEFKEIFHSPIWWATSQKNASSERHKQGSVSVSDFSLEDDFEQHIDRCLKFFSCPMPALVSLSKREQSHQMRERLRSGKTEEYNAMFAHCSSYKELQFLASLGKDVRKMKN